MSDLHIDDFYRDVAKTLVMLYNTFPRKITLYIEDICGPDNPDEFGLHSKRYEACLEAIAWLGNTGYLNAKSQIKQEAFEEVTLTHRTFLLLNSTYDQNHLNFLEPHASHALLINQLRTQLQTGTSNTLALCVRQLMVLSRELT